MPVRLTHSRSSTCACRPGGTALETISRLEQSDPTLQMVICTAYSDRSWEELAERMGETDNLLILKKPFDPMEVRQMAVSMTIQWAAHTQAELKFSELNEMVRARTREITQAKRLLETQNTQLEQARIAAELANQTKSEFLANMSHELRTPMTAILGYADLLAAENLPQKERTDAAKTIQQNGEHLLSLINELLDLSKVEAGEVRIEHLAFSPRRLANELVGLLKPRAEAKQLTIDLKVADDVPELIVSDPYRLRQIALNLLGNSLKFTETGGAGLELSLIKQLEPKGCRILIVEDTVTNQRRVATILKRAGATVEIAENGQLGVDSVRTAVELDEPFDLVLMDMQMPVLDGYDATRLLRSEGIAVPVVALTANAMAGDAEKCIQAGCDAYETKPLNRAHLLATIQGLLKK